MSALLLVATCFLAYSNGANDNFKGVASLLGSRTCGCGTALAWATVATGAGSLAAVFLAQSLLEKFSGQGFAANLATALLVNTANYHGLPVSTTHVSVGSLLGIGIATHQAKWKPVLAVLLSWIITLPCAALLSGLAYLVLHY
jgi:PiT family inorganic phosphate transporter